MCVTFEGITKEIKGKTFYCALWMARKNIEKKIPKTHDY